MEMHLLQVQDQDGWTIPPTLLADDDGVIRDQVLFYGHRVKPRRIASIVASKDGAHAALTIVEGSTPALQFNRLTAADALDRTTRCLRFARHFSYSGFAAFTCVFDSQGELSASKAGCFSTSLASSDSRRSVHPRHRIIPLPNWGSEFSSYRKKTIQPCHKFAGNGRGACERHTLPKTCVRYTDSSTTNCPPFVSFPRTTLPSAQVILAHCG